MGTNIDSSHVESVLADIKAACEKLVEHGLESLVVTVGSDVHFFSGSDTGRNFLDDRCNLISDFKQYCKEKNSSNWAHKRFSTSGEKPKGTSDGESIVQGVDNNVPVFDDDEDTDDYDSQPPGFSIGEFNGWMETVIKTEIGNVLKSEKSRGKQNKSKAKTRKRTAPVAVKRESKSTSEEPVEDKVQADDEAEDGGVQCNSCNKVLKTTLDLADHIGIEHEKEPVEGSYTCSKCGFQFAYEAHLHEHNVRNPDCILDIALKKKASDKSNIVPLSYEFYVRGHVSGEKKKETLKNILNVSKCNLPVDCPFCSKKFETIYAYQSHVLTHSKIGLRRCHICLKELNVQSSMPRHLAIHEERPYFCTTCFGRFQYASRHDHHVKYSCKKTKHRPGLICTDCGYQTKSISHLMLHKKKHTHVRSKCDECGKIFKSEENFLRHKAKSHKSPFQCPVCGKTFKHKDTLKRHEKDHGELKYVCKICGKPWSEESKLNRHLKTHSGIKLFPFICEVCGQAFSRKTILESHRLIHTGETPFKCDFEGCTKAFRSISSLKQHKEYHVSYNPFMCDFCGRSFKRECLMKHHRKSHTEWQWPCDYCGEKFNGRKRFKTHILTYHLDKVPEIEQKTKLKFFKCSICQKILSQSHVFKEHMAIHKGLKPNKCAYCGKGFSTRSNMRQHERTHTGGKKLRCHLCSKTYNDPKALQAHLKNRHDGKDSNVKGETESIETSAEPELQAPAVALTMLHIERRQDTTHLEMMSANRPLDLMSSDRSHDMMQPIRPPELMCTDRPHHLMPSDRQPDIMPVDRPLDLMPTDRPPMMPTDRPPNMMPPDRSQDMMSSERALNFSLPPGPPHPQPPQHPSTAHQLVNTYQPLVYQ